MATTLRIVGEPEERLIILPGDEDFCIDEPSPDWQNIAHKSYGEFCFIGRGGLILPATFGETTEYLEGGEYEYELQQIEEREKIVGSMLPVSAF